MIEPRRVQNDRADSRGVCNNPLDETEKPYTMLHFTRWKIIAIVLTCLAGLLVALPNFFSKETVAAWPSYMPKQQLRLGLDLQGGAHLLLAMDQDEIKKDWLDQSARRNRASL